MTDSDFNSLSTHYQIVSGNDDPSSGRALIVFSPSSKHHLMRHAGIEGSSLFLFDRSGSYFLHEVEEVARLLTGFAKEHAEIILVGSSKGAFGALLYGGLIAEALPDARVRVIAFSPQVQLWPFNGNLTFPSYTQLLKKSETEHQLRSNIEKYGNPASNMKAGNLSVRAIVGRENSRDMREARLLHTLAEIVRLPVSTHRVIAAFFTDLHSREAILAMFRNVEEREAGDADVASLAMTENESRLVEEFHALRHLDLSLHTALVPAWPHAEHLRP